MDGRVMLVTGGSRGIGAAVATMAAARGYDVALNYRAGRDEAEAVAATVRAQGRRGEAFAGDMAEPAGIAALFRAVGERFGRLDALVNNAGITGDPGRLDAADPATIARVMALNATGMMLVAREAVLRMSPRHGGRGGAIVNVSSRAPAVGSAGEYVWYAASKGAVDAFTLGLAREVAEEGIRVNAVAPGLIETGIHAEGRLARLTPNVPVKRAGTVAEVAEAVLFLLSDAASYVTGAVLPVGGGR